MSKRPATDFVRVAATAQLQLRRAEAIGKSLDVRMKQKRDVNPAWIPDEDFRRDMETVTRAVKECGIALERALEYTEKTLHGMTTDNLEAQFAAEILRSAQHIPDDMWQKMCDARSKRAT